MIRGLINSSPPKVEHDRVVHARLSAPSAPTTPRKCWKQRQPKGTCQAEQNQPDIPYMRRPSGESGLGRSQRLKPLPSEDPRAPAAKLKRIFPAAIENDEPRDERAQQCDEDAISHLIHADLADLHSEKQA